MEEFIESQLGFLQYALALAIPALLATAINIGCEKKRVHTQRKTGRGEETEQVLFVHSCKLYIYNPENKEVKEHGRGNIKILYDSNHVIMRRQEIHKICANFKITKGMKVVDKVGIKGCGTFSCIDFSEDSRKGVPTIFIVRFAEELIYEVFKNVFSAIEANLPDAPSEFAVPFSNEIDNLSDAESILFVSPCTLFNENISDEPLGDGNIKILSQSDKKILRVDVRREHDENPILVNFSITKNMSVADKPGKRGCGTLKCIDFSEDSQNDALTDYVVQFREETAYKEFKKMFNDIAEAAVETVDVPATPARKPVRAAPPPPPRTPQQFNAENNPDAPVANVSFDAPDANDAEVVVPEAVLFESRCNLYICNRENRDVLEPGKVHLQILFDLEKKNRVVMRCEERNTICANFKIVKGMKITDKNNFGGSACTLKSCIDVSEDSDGILTDYIVQFRDKDVYQKFKTLFQRIVANPGSNFINV